MFINISRGRGRVRMLSRINRAYAVHISDSVVVRNHQSYADNTVVL